MASRIACIAQHDTSGAGWLPVGQRLQLPVGHRLGRRAGKANRMGATRRSGRGRRPFSEVLMPGSVILGGARTPIGKLSGGLAGFSAMDLGGFAIAAALERCGVPADQVDYVFMGQVLQAGQGQITVRQAAVNGGISMSVPATTINKVCLSGLNSIFLADLLIQAGAAEVVVAGGMESMTKAPYLLPGARAGYRLGDGELVDSMMYDGLYCQFDPCAMGLSTERYNDAAGIARQAQDNFAALSHERAAAAIKEGRLADE